MKVALGIALLAAAAPLGAGRGTGSVEAAYAPISRDGQVVWAQSRAIPRQNDNVRFQGYDANGDGVITRAEWRGSARSFDVHDWNNDGVLSGNEIRTGAWRPSPEFDDYDDSYVFNDWNATRFRQLDRNGDTRIARAEWPYGAEEFFRVDRNRDGYLSQAEFVGSDFDDDRSDRFEYLDVNNNGTIERSEWHASPAAFDWLDRDSDGTLTRHEMGSSSAGAAPNAPEDVFGRIDTNDDNRISAQEWIWSRRSFTQRDANGDGALTREELGVRSANAGGGLTGPGTRTVVVDATQAWNDTGIVVQAGDRISMRATGTARLSGNAGDEADPSGTKVRRTAPDGPLPQEPAGALIARFGETGTPVVIGREVNAFRAPASGRLYLSVNDDHHNDNSGSFRVEVNVSR
jgi:Ca2+-binding EF-hand superfamily protein